MHVRPRSHIQKRLKIKARKENRKLESKLFLFLALFSCSFFVRTRFYVSEKWITFRCKLKSMHSPEIVLPSDSMTVNLMYFSQLFGTIALDCSLLYPENCNIYLSKLIINYSIGLEKQHLILGILVNFVT